MRSSSLSIPHHLRKLEIHKIIDNCFLSEPGESTLAASHMQLRVDYVYGFCSQYFVYSFTSPVVSWKLLRTAVEWQQFELISVPSQRRRMELNVISRWHTCFIDKSEMHTWHQIDFVGKCFTAFETMKQIKQKHQN